MFEKEADNFDALIIAIPDHTHALLLTEAIRLDKHIYCAKPITHPVCPIEFGCEMTEMALLGALALRTKRVLAWDAEAKRVTNHADANRYVDPPYRDGWTL